MRIVIKQNDLHRSSLHKGRTIPEFLIYLMEGNVPIECHNVIGVQAMESVKTQLFNTYQWTDKLEGIDRLTFEQFKKQY